MIMKIFTYSTFLALRCVFADTGHNSVSLMVVKMYRISIENAIHLMPSNFKLIYQNWDSWNDRIYRSIFAADLSISVFRHVECTRFFLF